MRIISFAHQKGGVGKSTLAINAAYSLLKRGYKVAVKDLDSQGTSFSILKNLESIDIYDKAEEISKDYDFLIVDTPPYLNPILIDVFLQSDLIIIPTRPSTPDIIAIGGTVNLFRKANAQAIGEGRKLKAKIVVNQNFTASSLADQLKEEIDSFGLGVFNQYIDTRVSFGRSLVVENGIFGDGDKKAIEEIDNFVDEILKELENE